MSFIIHSILTGNLSDLFDVFTLQTESTVAMAVLKILQEFILSHKSKLKTFKNGYKSVNTKTQYATKI